MTLKTLADALARLEATSSRGEMTTILAEVFSGAGQEERPAVVHLIQGQLAPPYEALVFGMGEKLLIDTLAGAYHTASDTVRRVFREEGDLGRVAEVLARDRKPKQAVSVQEAYRALRGVARISGKGSQQRKITELSSLLRTIGPVEARYVVRIVQGRLRLGAGEQTILDAIALGALGDAAHKPVAEHAYNLLPDLGRIARIAYADGADGLKRTRPEVGIPVRPALAQRLGNAGEIMDRLHRVQVEPKYDGFRLQFHRDGEKIRAFSRRLEDVTGMFPELAHGLRRQLGAKRAIVEGEAIVYNPESGEFLPFQVTMTRKRKYKVQEMAERYPLRLFIFDLLYADGTTFLGRGLKERRRQLERLVHAAPDDPVAVAEARIINRTEALQDYFDEMVQRGLEGVIAKRVDAPYHAGERNYNWVKLKRGSHAHLRDTVDVVLVGYLAGRGKRAALGIGSLLGAVYDPEGDRFRTVAKIGSGPSEAEWKELRGMLDEAASRGRPRRVDSEVKPDVWVEPRYVVTVEADEISRSPMHTCGKTDGAPGYALRFPRLTGGVRSDKAPEDATTEDEILDLYRLQGAPSA